ncbi:hypothetical protein F8388_012120, partial [Cannabis sativa]
QQAFFTNIALLPHILSLLGYNDLATAAPSLSADSSPSPWIGPFTLFTPSDTALRSCISCSAPNLLREHIVPGLFSMDYLRNLAFGTKIETLSPGRCLTITAERSPLRSNETTSSKIFISGLEITQPDLTYGFGKCEIGQLFIAGFGSSMLFGTIVGSLADKQGCKRARVTYCITYILSCITKHSPQYRVLMVGCVLGGIATSLLFSSFESWLVAEHNKRGFEQQWLSITFSKAIFLGNDLVAIVAGLLGNLLVDSLSLGPVAPFDAASCFLAIGMAVILSFWSENYGNPSESKDLLTQFRGAAVAIASDEKMALLGAIQSLFEGSMYTFVFLWTPALIPNDEDIPHGFIFATFILD